MKRLILSILLLSLFSLNLVTSPIIAAEQNVHQHGHSNGTLIINERKIIIELTVPSISIMGFEHTAKTEEEKAHVNYMLSLLSQAKLFQFHEKTTWFKRRKEIQTNLIVNDIQFAKEASSEDQHHHHHHEKEEVIEHSDIIVKLEYKMTQNKKVQSISTDLFKRTPNLEKLELIIVSDGQQTLYNLDHHQTTIKL